MVTQITFRNLSPRAAMYQFLDLLNVAQPNQDKLLTPREQEILTEFLLLPEVFKNQPFSLQGKRKVTQIFAEREDKHMTANTLNAKIYALTKKEYLKFNEHDVLDFSAHVKDSANAILNARSTNTDFKMVFNFDYKKL